MSSRVRVVMCKLCFFMKRLSSTARMDDITF